MRHCIEVTDLSKEEIIELVDLAKDIIANKERYANLCRTKKLATLFYEPSTRTRLSFTAAMMDLGGNVLGFSDEKSSSVSKGETLADTSRVVSAYADIIAIRHHKEGAALVASQYANIPVINAGDGSHSHPTQTLTDLLTINRELNRLDNLTIGLCGDLKYGRTVHSLIKALSLFNNIHFILISPKNLKLPPYMLKSLEESPNLTYEESSDIESQISKLDVLYMTRVQRERFSSLAEYEECKDCYILDSDKLNLAKEDMIVLHPLPRVGEISPDIDNDPRAAYFRQVENGKFIRMALIYTLLNLAEKDREEKLAVPRINSGIRISEKICPNPVCICNSEPLYRLETRKNNELVCAYCDSVLDCV